MRSASPRESTPLDHRRDGKRAGAIDAEGSVPFNAPVLKAATATKIYWTEIP